MKKCFVILVGIAFIVALSTSCCKTCECKNKDGEVMMTTRECGFGTKSCEEICKKSPWYSE